MLKKLLVMFILVFSFIQVGFSVCNFDLSEGNTCERYYSGFEEVYLEVSENSEFETSSLEIYHNNIPRFEFLSNQENSNTFSLDNALSHSGVYTFVGDTRNKFGNQNAWGEKEIIVDLYQPLPPKVDLILESSNIEGTVDHRGDRVFAYDVNGNVLSSSESDETGAFSLDLPLGSPSYVSLVTVSQNNLTSEPLERYIYTKKRGEYKYQEISDMSFDITIINSVNLIVSGKTSKRNFYVSGTASGEDDSLIYVNGQRVQIQDNVFGTFIELNTGMNTIEVTSNLGVIYDTFNVEYEEEFFSFEELSIQKIFDSTFTISGKTTSRKPFLLYVNGEFISEIEILSDNTFTFEATNVESEKNIVELYGENNVYESIVVYKDSTPPQVVSHNFENMGTPSTLLFEITDDVGIDYSSISLKLNTNTFLDYSQRFGNFITFDISNLSEGTYNFELQGSDLLSRTFVGEINDRFSISSNLDFDISSSIEGVKIFGSKIFSSKTTIDLELFTNAPVAFKHIYVDGVDHIDYNIESGSLILVNNLNLNSESGIIEFEYVDEMGVEFTKSFEYIVDTKKVELEIDSIINYARPISDEIGSYVRVTGKIDDPHFDWNSFYVNGFNPIFTSNFYFEALVKVSELDLLFSGSDILGNGFTKSSLSSLFEQDRSEIEILFEEENYVFGNLQRSFNGNEELVVVENSNFKRSHFEDQFTLSSEQREGLQYFEITGRNQFSQKEYSSSYTPIFDSTTPQIFVSEEEGFLLIDIDPTFGNILDSSLSQNGETIAAASCSSNFFNGECLKVGIGNYVLFTEDSYGNLLDTLISLESVSNSYPQFNSIYFHGTDTIVRQKDIFIQGSIVSNQAIDKVIIDGETICNFDGVNFICFEEASIGENFYLLELLNSEGISFYQEEIMIIRLGDNPLNLDVNFVSGIHEFGNRNYYFGETILTEISSNQDSTLSYYINGEKIIYGEIISGSTRLNLDLSNYIEGRDSTTIELVFKAENEDIRESSIFTLFYDRTKDLILEILIN